jgi:hypothetical protein
VNVVTGPLFDWLLDLERPALSDIAVIVLRQFAAAGVACAPGVEAGGLPPMEAWSCAHTGQDRQVCLHSLAFAKDPGLCETSTCMFVAAGVRFDGLQNNLLLGMYSHITLK